MSIKSETSRRCLFEKAAWTMTAAALALYYAGLSGKAEIAVGDGAAFVPVALDARCRAEVEVLIPANGNIRVYAKSS